MNKAVSSAPDAASLAALLQQQNDRRELVCSAVIALLEWLSLLLHVLHDMM